MKNSPAEKQKLEKIITLGIEIAQFRDIDLILEKILTLARDFVNAEAGSIYVKENGQLKFGQAQNEVLGYKLQELKSLPFSTSALPVSNDSIAGHVAFTGETLMIPDVYRLSGREPYSFDCRYDEISGYRTRSIMAFPLRTGHGEINGVLQLINARDGNGKITRFRKADEPSVRYFAANASVAIRQAQMSRDMIVRMVKMAEMRDPAETCAHADRVASYAVEIYKTWAGRLGVAAEEIEKKKDILRLGAMLHDIGKVGITDAILKKPGRLTPAEYEIMKRHTYLGAGLFPRIFSEFDESAAEIALSHHERWDGEGYPGRVDLESGRRVSGSGRAGGRKAEEIPPFARVVAIADVYDALCSRRAYKDSWEESRVLDILEKESGGQFDPDMLDAFFSSLDAIRAIDLRYPRE